MMGIIYLFRGVCMISTVFPLANHHYHCEPQVSLETNYDYKHLYCLLNMIYSTYAIQVNNFLTYPISFSDSYCSILNAYSDCKILFSFS